MRQPKRSSPAPGLWWPRWSPSSRARSLLAATSWWPARGSPRQVPVGDGRRLVVLADVGDTPAVTWKLRDDDGAPIVRASGKATLLAPAGTGRSATVT